jgi:hypothetical protein
VAYPVKPGMEYTWAESWRREREKDASSHHFFMIPCFFKLKEFVGKLYLLRYHPVPPQAGLAAGISVRV